MASKDWPKAIKYLEKLEARYPYGRYAQQAQLEVAYCYWKDDERASAVAAADRFIKLYPNHPNVDYAWYLKGLINFNETLGLLWRLDHARPLRPRSAGRARSVRRLQGSGHPLPGLEVRRRLRARACATSSTRSRQYEVHVARYYMRRGAYLAAANRAQYAIKTYQSGAGGRGSGVRPGQGVRRARHGRRCATTPRASCAPTSPTAASSREGTSGRMCRGGASGIPTGESVSILVIGAAGMIGRKLTERLAKEDAASSSCTTSCRSARAASCPDLSAPGEAEKLVAARPDLIFHLAAIVSGEAEADFEKGYRINLDGTRRLFEAIRKVGDGYKPRVVFASSIAVFGAPFPEAIGDEFVNAPLTSYGTQKTICELLLSDYSRQRLLRRHRHPPADDLRAAGQAQPRRVRVLLRHHPRAARRPGSGAAGAGDGAPLVRLAARGDRLPRACGKARYCTARRAPQPQHAGHFARRSASRSRRCGASPARRR